MAWIARFIAGIFEVVLATAMKQSDGFTKTAPPILTFATTFVSFGLLGYAMRPLPLGTSYAIWTGIGAIGAFIVGVVWFGESLGTVRTVAALMIVGGLALMKIGTPPSVTG